MAAAPADFRPADAVEHKIKKRADGVSPDDRPGREPRHPGRSGRPSGRGAAAPVLVGFAAETGDAEGSVLDHARAKLARKGCDLLVVNDVSGGAVFGADDNQAVILGADGDETTVPSAARSVTWRTRSGTMSCQIWAVVGVRRPETST